MRVFRLSESDEIEFIKNLNFKMKTIYKLGISSGLRISDIIQLKKHILNVQKPTIKEKKTGKRNRIYIPKKLKIDLQKIADKSQNDYIFSSISKSGHISRQAVYKAFKKSAEISKINTNIGTQSMRKKKAYKLYKRNGILTTSKKLNHDNIATTALYLLSEKELKNE